VAAPGFEVFRARTLSAERSLDARAFAFELRALLQEFREVETAELLITAIDVQRDAGVANTDVRYDIVGKGREAFRVQASGAWRMAWRREGQLWRVSEWSTTRGVRSRAQDPVFAEISAAALGGNESFRRQLAVGLDEWVATIDAGLMRDSNGHHGVSVGDADGDGLEDLYVAQPSGLPNRLFRAKGDGTFEDATERAGLGVLDDTSQSLFADVDNDGDQDLVLTLPAGPALFVNDGKGRFARAEGAFRFQESLRGTPMSIAMADYDRDGFLDLYLCVYSFYYGAGEDKAGTPMPYHDAQNGPPSVLFKNDGHGRFTDVTREAGLEAVNDRYHFAAAWGDYDDDGWPDLLVANDFGRKNLYRNLGKQGRRHGEVRGGLFAVRRRRPRRGHERDVPRLRQRRTPRHLLRQHVERRRPARDREPSLHAGRPAGRARALPAARARQHASPQPGRRAASRTSRSRRARRRGAGPGRPTRSTSTATASRTCTSRTAC
jgi:hypothetical protein